ncbi:hypothetical protein B0T19DRAFT_462419 [Cercophora scortea]|uniref:Uncharacterized protein n=1 Tax=Cercophora scortea TaxID=314031 RepID=A0AAE0IE45_9PEZI|nr:hypothetical protein B0T19DRAFT_462419 [Cercophora scortea]
MRVTAPTLRRRHLGWLRSQRERFVRRGDDSDSEDSEDEGPAIAPARPSPLPSSTPKTSVSGAVKTSSAGIAQGARPTLAPLPSLVELESNLGAAVPGEVEVESEDSDGVESDSGDESGDDEAPPAAVVSTTAVAAPPAATTISTSPPITLPDLPPPATTTTAPPPATTTTTSTSVLLPPATTSDTPQPVLAPISSTLEESTSTSSTTSTSTSSSTTSKASTTSAILTTATTASTSAAPSSSATSSLPASTTLATSTTKTSTTTTSTESQTEAPVQTTSTPDLLPTVAASSISETIVPSPTTTDVSSLPTGNAQFETGQTDQSQGLISAERSSVDSGTAVGIAFGVIASVVILAIAAYLFMKRKARSEGRSFNFPSLPGFKGRSRNSSGTMAWKWWDPSVTSGSTTGRRTLLVPPLPPPPPHVFNNGGRKTDTEIMNNAMQATYATEGGLNYFNDMESQAGAGHLAPDIKTADGAFMDEKAYAMLQGGHLSQAPSQGPMTPFPQFPLEPIVPAKPPKSNGMTKWLDGLMTPRLSVFPDPNAPPAPRPMPPPMPMARRSSHLMPPAPAFQHNFDNHRLTSTTATSDMRW